MKIFLLTHLRQDSVPLAIFHDHHKMYTRRSCLDDVSAWICIKPLIERLLQGLLPRLQALLLRRHRTDWPIVVGALVTLSMSADDRIFHGSPGFKTRLEGPEDGWNVLLGLYVAAYGGYHISNRRPGHGSSDSQGDRNGLKLSHRLNAWMRQEGVCFRLLCS